MYPTVRLIVIRCLWCWE